MFKNLLLGIRLPRPLLRVFGIVSILNRDMARCDLFKHASAMAYVTLFSLIPSLAAIFGLVSLFKPFLGDDSELLVLAKEFILSNLASGTGESVISYFEEFLSKLDMKKIGLTGVAGMIVTLILLLRQIEIALNRIWLVKKPRNILTRFIYFWTFLTLGTFVIGLSVGIFSGFDFTSLNPFDDSMPVHRGMLSRFVPLLGSFLFFTLLYKIVPNTFVRIQEAAFGALPAAILFLIAGKFYGWYATTFTSYQAIYGALAAIPLFLLWLYIIWLITLFGSLLSWRFQQTFELGDDLDDQSPVLSAEEKLRNHRLQTVTPILSLLAIYQNFEESTGRGVSGFEIAMRLNLPAPWVEEAASLLIDMGYVHAFQDAPSDDSQGFMQKPLTPAYPTSSLDLGIIRERLVESSDKWLCEWEHSWDVDLKGVIKAIWDDEAKNASKINLAELIKGLPIHQRSAN